MTLQILRAHSRPASAAVEPVMGCAPVQRPFGEHARNQKAARNARPAL